MSEPVTWAEMVANPNEGARRILANQVDARNAQIRTLRNALIAAKIPHYVCEDCFYSCPKSGECCNEEADGKCWCGADAHNAKIDEALK